MPEQDQKGLGGTENISGEANEAAALEYNKDGSLTTETLARIRGPWGGFCGSLDEYRWVTNDQS